MAQQIKVGRFPRWLRKALKAQVLTYQQAELIHNLAHLVNVSEQVVAPAFLEQQMEALYLLDLPAYRA